LTISSVMGVCDNLGPCDVDLAAGVANKARRRDDADVTAALFSFKDLSLACTSDSLVTVPSFDLTYGGVSLESDSSLARPLRSLLALDLRSARSMVGAVFMTGDNDPSFSKATFLAGDADDVDGGCVFFCGDSWPSFWNETTFVSSS